MEAAVVLVDIPTILTEAASRPTGDVAVAWYGQESLTLSAQTVLQLGADGMAELGSLLQRLNAKTITY